MADISKIATRHPEYEKYLPVVEFCRTAVKGSRDVKEAKEVFLPRTEGQKNYLPIVPEDGEVAFNYCWNDPYADYLERAYWYPATGISSGAIAEMIADTPPVYSEGAEERIGDFLKNLDGRGTSVVDAIKKGSSEINQAMRFVGLVNQSVSTEGMTRNEAANIYPNCIFYKFENLINWGTDWEDGSEIVTFAVIEEEILETGEDGFTKDTIKYYTYPHLNENGIYQISYYKETDQGIEEAKDPDFPLNGGKPMNRIPIWITTKDGKTTRMGQIIIEPIANANKGHFINSADYEQGLFKTANPTLFAKGLGDQDVLRLGPNGGIVSNNSEADAKYIEYTGQGLGAIENAMRTKETDMSKMAVGLILDSTTERTATEVSIDARPKYSALKSISISLEEMLNEMIQFALDWKGEDYDFSMTLNKDFISENVDAQMLTSLTQSLLSGSISYTTYFAKLQEGGVISPNRTQEAEESDIENEDFGGQNSQ
ncbi:MAG: DUF4055 domain-containing protein [Candidatus Thorarchaeota archaeon]|nr:DUF4055 domain-containing protein [Candidatus Thorarchaeota archaeon]